MFWYRTSPAAIVSSIGNPLPTSADPPFVFSGMRMVYLDARGRLLEFQALSPQVDESPAAPTAAPDWAPLFEFAGLSRAAFHEVEPLWLPAESRRRARRVGRPVSGDAGDDAPRRGRRRIAAGRCSSAW